GAVEPELPELPLAAGPRVAVAEPRRPVLVAVVLELAAPVAPVAPELPDWATGFERAFEVALPVAPVLVALDWALAAPVDPVVAVGLTLTVELPPLPPLADPAPTLLPPTAEP